MGVPKTGDHIQIQINMPNLSQKSPVSSKGQNLDFKDMDFLCTFKINIESYNFEHGCTKDQSPYQNQDQDTKLQSGTSSILQSSNWDLKDMDILCTFKIKIESQDLEHSCTKDK